MNYKLYEVVPLVPARMVDNDAGWNESRQRLAIWGIVRRTQWKDATTL
ncbi:MAG: hypothetical protein ACKV2Q_32830 [Planctomycetaceae bacterium]